MIRRNPVESRLTVPVTQVILIDKAIPSCLHSKRNREFILQTILTHRISPSNETDYRIREAELLVKPVRIAGKQAPAFHAL